MSDFRCLTFSLPAELEEPFTAELWARDLAGCEIQEAAPGVRRLIAWYPEPLPSAMERWDLADWNERGVVLESSTAVGDRDYLQEYRAASRPLELGRGFLVLENDPDDDGAATALENARQQATDQGRSLLRIPARTAFGTGSHESTRLVMHWLEEIPLQGSTVLDVGTGTGILSLAALQLGARRAVGFDLDAQSVVQARINAGLNPTANPPHFFAGRLPALAPPKNDDERWDVALVNVLPERIAADLPRLADLLAAGALMVSSGNLHERRDETLRRFAALGFACRGEKVDGEWAAYLLEKTPEKGH